MSDPILSILICTLPKRSFMLHSLTSDLLKQSPEGKVEIIRDDSVTDSIGEKRNRLLQEASGKYVAFVDDDDKVSDTYIDFLLKAAETDCDCASLMGEYSVNGVFDGIFEHSIKYNEWRTTIGEVKYERYQNHLNLIRSDIAKQFKFPETNHGEDHDWSKQVHESGLLKTEYYIPDIIYYYNYISNK